MTRRTEGAAPISDVLVSGSGWGDIAPYDGVSPVDQGGFALFSGNRPGHTRMGAALATIYGTCDPYFAYLTPIGDVTGDGHTDVAVIGSMAMVGGKARGAVYVLSLLGESRGLLSVTQASGAGVVGHAPLNSSLGGNFEALTSLDLDQDGVDELVVSDSYARRIWIFRGPVSGFLDIGDADLTIEGGPEDKFYGYALATGEFTGDGIPDLIVGDHGASYGGPNSGAVTILSGALIRDQLDAGARHR